MLSVSVKVLLVCIPQSLICCMFIFIQFKICLNFFETFSLTHGYLEMGCLPDSWEFSIYLSSLIPLLLENILCIFILLSLLRIVLSSRIWSILMNVPCTKNVYSAAVGWSSLYISISLHLLFGYSLSFVIFCLFALLITQRGMLKLLMNYLFSFCFLYFKAVVMHSHLALLRLLGKLAPLFFYNIPLCPW